MIVSKPKKQALFSLGVFILICLGLGSYNLLLLWRGSTWFFNYLMAAIFVPLGLVLLLRQLFNYKIVSLGNNKIQVWYPLRWRVRRWPLADLRYWQEVIIQTRTGVFKQLEIQFADGMVKISNQENTSYPQVMQYLQKKAAGKRKK